MPSSKTILTRGASGLAALLLVGTALPANAATFIVDFEELNDSGVEGTATLDYNESAQILTVAINATGLAANQPHLGHIHGLFNSIGQPIDSVTPPPSADTDGDGFIELGEGAVFYGPIILPLSGIGDAPGGVLNYMMTFDLTDSSIFGGGFNGADLFPLTFREIVLHGDFVDPNAGAGTMGIINGQQGSYSAALPVASGEIRAGAITAAVPEPGTWAMMLFGFGAIGFAMRRRKQKGSAHGIRLSYT